MKKPLFFAFLAILSAAPAYADGGHGGGHYRGDHYGGWARGGGWGWGITGLFPR